MAQEHGQQPPMATYVKVWVAVCTGRSVLFGRTSMSRGF